MNTGTEAGKLPAWLETRILVSQVPDKCLLHCTTASHVFNLTSNIMDIDFWGIIIIIRIRIIKEMVMLGDFPTICLCFARKLSHRKSFVFDISLYFGQPVTETRAGYTPSMGTVRYYNNNNII